MAILTAPADAETLPQGPWLARAQGAAIFTGSVNLFSTALANFGLVVFLLLFLCVLVGPERRNLAWSTFPRWVALAIGIYLGWQAIGMLYTDAPRDYAWESLYADRKILYILPLALLFGAEAPRRSFLVGFMLVNVVALALSFGLALPAVHSLFPRRMPTNVLHSHATQAMSFAMACFLSLWYASQSPDLRRRLVFLLLSLGFLLNIVTVTTGRSGYLAFLVFVVVAFGLWRGLRGVLIGLAAASLIAVGVFQLSSTVRERVMQGVDEAGTYMSVKQVNSLGERMLLYHTALEMVAQHPLLGSGTGSFKGQFAALVSQRYTGWKAASFDDPHNQYLSVLVENGAIGLATFLFLLVCLYRACDKSTAYGQMAAASLLAWSATSLFSGHFRTFPEGHMIVFVLGVLMTPLHAGGAPSGARNPA